MAHNTLPLPVNAQITLSCILQPTISQSMTLQPTSLLTTLYPHIYTTLSNNETTFNSPFLSTIIILSLANKREKAKKKRGEKIQRKEWFVLYWLAAVASTSPPSSPLAQVSKAMRINEDDLLQQILMRSRCHKGRLLYYFAKQQSESMKDTGVSSWCGWHTDHGSLTGLTSGMYIKNGVEVSCPDLAAGLYVRTRNNQIVRAVFAEDELAYQIGEITEILSQGHLCATPHSVQAPKGEESIGVERSTFALFMQPDWDEFLKFPAEIHHHQELIPPNGTLTFGEYSEALLHKYYNRKL